MSPVNSTILLKCLEFMEHLAVLSNCPDS